MVLVLSRGGFCPKDRRQAEGLLEVPPEMEVGYCRLVTISTEVKVLQGYAIEAVKIPLSGSVVGLAGDIGAVLTRQDVSTILQCGPSRRGRTGPTRGDR